LNQDFAAVNYAIDNEHKSWQSAKMPNRKAILVADDSLEDAFILKRAFDKAGTTVPLLFVRDGKELIDYLSGADGFADRQNHPMPRVLLLDLKMPKVDGFDVLRWLQRQPELRRLIVTVLSSSNESQDVNLAYDLGANSYVVKPSSMSGYAAVVEKLRDYWVDVNRPPDYVLS
jgi:CheY-like chemotaxis protein